MLGDDDHTDNTLQMVNTQALLRPALEWALWILLAVTAYAQSANFAVDIAEYAFGATGWPRTVCLAIMVGATLQFGMICWRTVRDPAPVVESDQTGTDSRMGGRKTLQIGFLLLPLVYLMGIPSLGFFVLTPVFIILILVLLRVLSWQTIIGVTGIVYGLVLLLFTRLFYVALPVGNLEPFYSLNNAIVQLARTGL